LLKLVKLKHKLLKEKLNNNHLQHLKILCNLLLLPHHNLYHRHLIHHQLLLNNLLNLNLLHYLHKKL
jgi:hypothetical protein